MKVLIVHNDYGKPSGEEAVVEKMKTLLEKQGIEVFYYRCSSETLKDNLAGKAKGFFSGIYSRGGVRGLREAIHAHRPDIVNIHNLYPQISPAALFECKKANLPVVMTIHNYRLVCPTGLFMRNGVPFEYCLKKGNEWGCIKFNCEHSKGKSIGYALRNYTARVTGAYRKNVDFFACITHFQQKKLIQAGFNEKKIIVIPNSAETPDSYIPTEGKYIAYAGRLSSEKGFELLLEVAKRHPQIEFKFAGEIREKIPMPIPKNVQMLGKITQVELKVFLRDARFVVIPSRCYEGFPVTILEAASMGKTTISPNHGGFTEIIGKGKKSIGILFQPNNTDDLEKKIIDLWNSPERAKELGEKAFRKLHSEYNSDEIAKIWKKLLVRMIG